MGKNDGILELKWKEDLERRKQYQEYRAYKKENPSPPPVVKEYVSSFDPLEQTFFKSLYLNPVRNVFSHPIHLLFLLFLLAARAL